MYVKNGTGILKKVLLCKPSFLKSASVNGKELALDVEKMEKEHEVLVKTYEDNGIEVVLLEAHKDTPNMVFSRDLGGCVKEGYILGKLKEPVRHNEHIYYKDKMKELNIPVIFEVEKGIFEGGDFAFLNENTIAIGLLERTDEIGYKEVKNGLAKYGYEVIAVPCNKEYLHLDMCFNLLDDHLAVAYKEGLPENFLKKLDELQIEIIEVKEDTIFRHGCNLQALGDKRVLSLKENVYVNEELRKRDLKVIEVDISEILKAGGGIHCMTFPLNRI